jgi:branched-chain amino acid transport system substrate-binding protein
MGFICAPWPGTGTHLPLIQEVLQYVYARGKGAGPERDVGTGPWMRGMLRGLLTTEALRTAMRHFGHQPLTGAQVQWGLEHLSFTPAYLKALGAEGLMPPITLSCRDHEGGGGVKFQQWDGTQETVLTDWITTDQALVRPLVEAAAAKYAQEKGITPLTVADGYSRFLLGCQAFSSTGLPGATGAFRRTHAAPNKALHLTAYSVRSAPASGGR